jgi:hypothetical protein
MFGLVAYPAQGVYKSVKGSKKDPVAKAVEKGRTDSLGEVAKGMPGSERVVGMFETMIGK